MDTVARFIAPQENRIDIVKRELLNRRKETHWMWFMFPQLKGLGDSYLSTYYGLSGVKEARTYYRNEYLKKNLNDLTDIVLSYNDNTKLLEVFGEIDVEKLRSCMTLFYIATQEERFKKLLDKFYGGKLDINTIELIKNK